ncbi:hypothetical protein OSB04_023976 [Centaurea solstitialis]|uniref:RNase H type-1 domain-containing protein n=1 Tax=Centaurea solstitialis TaxID=347529 RepID=A0AA38SLX3_9ASTR|nr:hypothetical protein OSB04_023976 [Centaurea solstitialis]
MMDHSGVPPSLWAKAIATACFNQNRTMIVKRTGKTAYKMINKPKPIVAEPDSSSTLVSSDAFVTESSLVPIVEAYFPVELGICRKSLFSTKDTSLDVQKFKPEKHYFYKVIATTDKVIYCYKVMTFDLKNASSTYQRLVNMKFQERLGRIDVAHNLGAKVLHVQSDSLLIVNQMNGEFQAKDSKMMAYLKTAKIKANRFLRFMIDQIPRDQNIQAEALANLGSAFNEPSLNNIPIIHLTTSSVEVREIAQINEQVYSWSLDIWN